MFDIIIVGGGPAGSTLARLLGGKYKVLLLEKRGFNKTDLLSNYKCCGGLLAPDAQKMLATFGLGIPNSVLISPQLFAVRTIDIQNNIERFYQRHYININREEFDKWLLSLASSNVEVRTNCVYYSFEEKDETIVVKYFKDGKECIENARLLVGADGAISKVRRQASKQVFEPKKYISIQEWFEVEENKPYYGAIFDREITDFYSWTIPKENYLIVGTALEIDKKPDEKFELLKQKLLDYGFSSKNSVYKNAAFLLRPESTKQISTCRGNIVLIGEAAGLISPSSAEGFSYAFQSALKLAKALEIGVEGYEHRYKKEVKSIKRNILVKNLKCPAMYNQFIRKQIMRSGVTSIDIYTP